MRQSKTYTIQKSATHAVLRFHTAVLDRTNSRQISARVLQDLDFGTHILIDLTEVSYLDSAGLGSVFDCIAAVKRGGGQVVLCAPAHSVKALLRLARLDDHVPVFHSVEEATATVPGAFDVRKESNASVPRLAAAAMASGR